ncbi:ClpP family protease [Pyxidicoccus trucidator]|uniref:ClpP family protease n=1 Tax=Pyxidicoccus trucidator TaxID=2709662 RepID=UPI0013DA9DCE|nr:ATP-dependent Clp protease proteolytic subunit [Pyxidicoccus trucidator]
MGLLGWWRRLWGGSTEGPRRPEPVRAPEGRRGKDLEERLLRDRIILLGTPINDEVANQVVAMLLFLQSEDPRAGITLYLNTPGGSVTAALAIHDTIGYLQLPVTTVCMRTCSGIAALLLACGTRGRRFSLPEGKMSLVPFSAGASGEEGTSPTIRRQEIQRLQLRLTELLAEHTGQPPQQVSRDLESGRDFDARAAVEYGLIDEVVSTPPK